MDRRRVLKLLACGGISLVACSPNQKTPVSITPKNVSTSTVTHIPTPLPTSTSTSTPIPTNIPTATPTLQIEIKGAQIEKKEIDVAPPEILRKIINVVKILRDKQGDIYAKEAWINVPLEKGSPPVQILLLVQKIGMNEDKWIMAPAEIGIPNKDGKVKQWGDLADGKKGWIEPKEVSRDSADVTKRKKKVMELITWMKEQEPAHEGTVAMYLPDLLNFGMRVDPQQARDLYIRAVESFIFSEQLKKEKYFHNNNLPEFKSVKEFEDWMRQRGGVVPYKYIAGKNASGRKLLEANVNMSQLDLILFTPKDTSENLFVNVFSSVLTEKGNNFFGFPYMAGIGTQMVGYWVNTSVQWNMIIVDVMNAAIEKLGHESMGYQYISDGKGERMENTPIIASALVDLVININRRYIIDNRNTLANPCVSDKCNAGFKRYAGVSRSLCKRGEG